MVERQPSWDKYEAAILLEGLLASMKGELTRSDAIKAVSRDLKAMALHRGMEVDEVYRNTNGISFQMKSMESAYLGRTVFKPATKLFADVAGLYHESYDEYQKLLKEARAMISDRKTVEDDFMRYFAERVSPAQLSELYRCYSEIETFCLKIKVLQNPLFETTDFETIKKVQRTIEQNKIFRITRRRQINKIVDAGRHYYNYIKEGLYARITDGKTVEGSSTIEHEMSNQSMPDVGTTNAGTPVTAYIKTEQDERLLQKYPAIYNQIYNTLKASHESQRVTIREICEAINHTARPAVVEEILDNVSWASNIGDSYIFSEDTPAIAPDTSNTESSHSQDTTFEIDFHADFDLAYTKPERFSYFGQDKETGDSWSALYIHAIFHTDAVQAVGHIEIDVNSLGVDMLSASAHKFNGPKGIGFLYVRKGTPLMPYASGGGQEHHMRAGTENIASIVGMATALKKNVAVIKDTASHLALLENRLLIGLSNANILFSRNGSEVHIPGNLSISFPGYSGEALLHRLDLIGICVSTGSACNSNETQISHVLQAIGLEPDLAKGTIRLSFGRNNSENDVDIIVESLQRILG